MKLDPINWHSFFFLLFSLVACGFALGVVLSTHIVRMAFYLIISLGATSGIFFLAGADFVAAMQLMIYVGGTLVLLIFGVMLTAQGPFISMKTSGGEWILGLIVGGTLLGLLLETAFSVKDWQGPAAVATEEHDQHAADSEQVRLAVQADEARADDKAHTDHAANSADAGDWRSEESPRTATRIGLALLGARVDALEEDDASRRAGMPGYLLPFEIVSVHLLVVLVGAAYLARAKRRVSA